MSGINFTSITNELVGKFQENLMQSAKSDDATDITKRAAQIVEKSGGKDQFLGVGTIQAITLLVQDKINEINKDKKDTNDKAIPQLKLDGYWGHKSQASLKATGDSLDKNQNGSIEIDELKAILPYFA